jgi:two-component system OmpR family response regulator
MKEEVEPAKCGPWERVLLVDDDPDVGPLVVLALGQVEGYTVEVCGSSIDAVERARSFRPDLILLDVMMPGMDGPETLKALRADETTASIPVIFMSAGAAWRDALQYRKLGAMGVIPKPFDPALLPATLRGICCGPPIEQPIKEASPRDFDDLRGAYLSELPENIGAMEAAAATLVTAGWQRSSVEALFHLAHRMAGSAGLFGLDGVARAAGILESMLKRLLEAPRWPPSRPPDDVATVVKALARCVPGGARRARRARQARANL